jgi:hypothetical protein
MIVSAFLSRIPSGRSELRIYLVVDRVFADFHKADFLWALDRVNAFLVQADVVPEIGGFRCIFKISKHFVC